MPASRETPQEGVENRAHGPYLRARNARTHQHPQQPRDHLAGLPVLAAHDAPHGNAITERPAVRRDKTGNQQLLHTETPQRHDVGNAKKKDLARVATREPPANERRRQRGKYHPR